MWDLETERVIYNIEKKHAKKVLFQAPEGLKLSIEKEIEKIKKYFKDKNTELELIIWGESCFGACDLCDGESILKKLNIDLIIHYGHEELPYSKPEIPTIFVHGNYKPDIKHLAKIKDDIDNIIKEHNNQIVVTTTIQFKKMLSEYNPSVILGCRANITEKIGNEYNILYVGTGRFHPLMLSYKFKKSIKIYNPITRKPSRITNDEINKFIKKRIGMISKLLLDPPKKIGVVLSTKKGQCRINVFNNILNLLNKNHIEYIPIILNNISPSYLIYDVDAYIVCSCPRIVLDDYLLYNRPLLTPKEFEMYIKRDFEYRFDEVLLDDFK